MPASTFSGHVGSPGCIDGTAGWQQQRPGQRSSRRSWHRLDRHSSSGDSRGSGVVDPVEETVGLPGAIAVSLLQFSPNEPFTPTIDVERAESSGSVFVF